jgi:hypothetical protein
MEKTAYEELCNCAKIVRMIRAGHAAYMREEKCTSNLGIT